MPSLQTDSPLQIRSRVMHLIREFFELRDFMEVDTPILSPAIIPEAHIDPMTAQGQFLMASPEIYMKRLLARGFKKIFQICKTFRKEEAGNRHLPEFTLLEWYEAHTDYRDLMASCQGLVRHIASGLGLGQSLTYRGISLDLSRPFDRVTVHQAFAAHGSVSCDHALATNRFDEIMAFEIEPCLGLKKPVFIMDYPLPLASLAKPDPQNPKLAQRVELYMAGLELANGFSELTDTALQRQRFEYENRQRLDRGLSPLPLPEKFLNELKAMPEAAGMALGVDRLVMLFADAPRIDQVVAFPPSAC